MNHITSDPLDRSRFPVDEWAFVEDEYIQGDEGLTETVFAVGNGYLGLRGNPDEGRGGHSFGTFVNGFHETWPIRHAEEAFGFARVGQTIVNVPDAKVIRLYVDDEPFVLFEADILRHTRRLDFRDGVLTREIDWRTPSGKRVLVTSRRLVSFEDRHLVVIEYEVTMLDSSASLLISSQILNRQDMGDQYHAGMRAAAEAFDPRKAESFDDRVLQPVLNRNGGTRAVLGYRTTNSGMTIAVGAEHRIETDAEWDQSSQIDDDIAKHVYRVKAQAGQKVRLTKTITYHTSRGVPPRELADRCDRTLDRAAETPTAEIFEHQRAWLDDFWQRSDVQVAGQPEIQQAVRWNLFQLAQATARTDGQGVAAKGVTGSGYGGHYFWDTEIYVLPFLTYTSPNVARNALRFRLGMLDAARDRAVELNQRGALFPWRTINGLESSAYYAAGTAQYHIDADISHALSQYVQATGDEDFLQRGAVDILVETARLWADLGFWRSNGDQRFHIDGVTGPDEYTTVVDDNLYTNVMARANLRAAVRAVTRLKDDSPVAFDRMVDRLGLEEHEITGWQLAAEAMHIPYDDHRGIHPQDAQFLDKELWDLEATPANKRPLLLHYHPLVIYRFQVLKQADVVLALYLQGDEFTPEQKLRNFEYYDALTTGDSTLSGVVQSIIAAEVGHHQLSQQYFLSSLYVDLADLHKNTSDGVHVASTGGIWSALVNGYGGMRDWLGSITFDPRLPADWDELSFRVAIKGSRVRVDLAQHEIVFTVETGDAVTLSVRGDEFRVTPEAPVRVALEGQGPRITTRVPTTSDLRGLMRADGSVITASIPTISVDRYDEDEAAS
ncbi:MULTISPECIES: glycoside hydrolase family 65 protein [unclassified Frigoribacterium]|uniref:glycoside hydrolase family 65 protein n=1 Tax=unclassified Frigoribacterium TaxID=2627005 RepID=UPI0006F2E3FD|nr:MULTISPECIES: glycosyl hydrolase family 65 protein [unclassified Frigoribacterium]NQW85722.1 glycoside hydrolase family 65 protein [Frigoribacterium sp. VKM Ac-2860]NQX07054.1 glycoside hydrolase family 65 protein [Frigoribacterium sp. VKM Ac-2859]KQM26832.1 kojibiose phosphorylase [Frigoribacterium sp. Leaf8]MBD8141577.1 glycoside hydrolase family 65 protein [Frigoribacterium sp. CFBP 13605]ROS56430.1 alpha,alpha-trehalose phosphorylase [Frigoribacterium sp. PhB118]